MEVRRALQLHVQSCASLNVSYTALYTAGGFDEGNKDQAFVAHNSGDIEVVPSLMSNHEEGDSRVWFHAKVTSCRNIVIYSPVRDTFHVGLPLMSIIVNKVIIVQLRAAKADDLFLNINLFYDALTNDLQLQKIGADMICYIPTLIQLLYIVSGCDFTSFLRDHSKRSFLQTFYRDCEFIAALEGGGSLHNYCADSWEKGLLLFYRLNGPVYFIKFSSEKKLLLSYSERFALITALWMGT